MEYKLTNDEVAQIRARGLNIGKAQEAKRKAWLEANPSKDKPQYTKGETAGGWVYILKGGMPIALVHPKHIDKFIASPDLYEALKAWDELRAMHPLDSGADIDEIFWRCCSITDKALAKGGQDG